jgi:hypothetical protein
MEFVVFGVERRRASLIVACALLFGMVAAFGTVTLLSPDATRTRAASFSALGLPVVAFTTLMILVMIVLVMMTVRIRVEHATGEVFQLYGVFGLEVRRRRFALAEFDRVSLTRAFRAGYRVSLLGHQQDLMVCVTNDLGAARDRAGEVAAACGLKVTDQL